MNNHHWRRLRGLLLEQYTHRP